MALVRDDTTTAARVAPTQYVEWPRNSGRWCEVLTVTQLPPRAKLVIRTPDGVREQLVIAESVPMQTATEVPD